MTGLCRFQFDFVKDCMLLSRFVVCKNDVLLKGVHLIIFVLNMFPNSHLIQKCIHNQQLFQNRWWNCIHFWFKWELGKMFDTKIIEWTHFNTFLVKNLSCVPLLSFCKMTLKGFKNSFKKYCFFCFKKKVITPL